MFGPDSQDSQSQAIIAAGPALGQPSVRPAEAESASVGPVSDYTVEVCA